MSKLSDLADKAKDWAAFGSSYPYNPKGLASKMTPYADRAMNNFAKTNLFYSNSLFLQTQDPTVFGFKLLFHFDQVSSPLLFGVTDQAFDNAANAGDESKNSALAFLLRKKDYQRASYLRKFIRLLHGVNNQAPWYFQSLGGLKDAWKRDMTKPLMKPDAALTVDCLESVDLRMTALMDLYRKACFDWKYRREVVPLNLRQFRLSVYVYEARVFHNPNDISLIDPAAAPPEYGYGGNIQGEFAKKNATSTAWILGQDETMNDPNTFDVNIVEGVRMSGNRNLFHFDFCEFDFSEPSHLETISNAEPVEVKQNFKIKYRDVEEENLYTWWSQLETNNMNPAIADSFIASLDAAALDIVETAVPGEPATNPTTMPANNDDQELLNKAKEMAAEKAKALEAKAMAIKSMFDPKELAKRAGEQALAEAANAISARLTAALLGNIYGFSLASLTSASTLNKLTSPTALLNAGASLINGKKGPGNDLSIGDNVDVGSGSLTNTTGTPSSGNEYSEPVPNVATGYGDPDAIGAQGGGHKSGKSTSSETPLSGDGSLKNVTGVPSSQGPDHHRHKKESAPDPGENEGTSLNNDTKPL